ncbi:Serine palmitoyltransferase subunit I [Carabus blaptoides fortunei]
MSANVSRYLAQYKPDPMYNEEVLVENENVQVITDKVGTKIHILGREFINLGCNNIFNIMGHADTENLAVETIRKYGVGSCGPRGFYGTVDVHLELEQRIADFMKMEEAVVYSYGFSTISSAIPAYCKKNDVVFCDEMISFPAKQGFAASKCKVVYFKHNDPEDLEARIQEFNEEHRQNVHKLKKFLILEGIYGLTGTICNLPPLIKLRSKYKMRLFIDETMSLGALGKTGRGVTEHFAVDPNEVDMIMASLEGFVGSVGGFCVGSHFIIEHQRLSGLGYCFSASQPPCLTRIATWAFDYLDENIPRLFNKIEKKCMEMQHILENIPNIRVKSDIRSPLKIFQFADKEGIITDPECYKKFLELCQEDGIIVSSITDCNSHDNIRVTMNTEFTDEDMQKISKVFEKVTDQVMTYYGDK